MKRIALTFATLAAVLVLGACSGATTYVGLPAASPWNTFDTVVASSHTDLTVVTVGSNISATLSTPGETFTVCTSDQGGFYALCRQHVDCLPPGPAAECAAQAPSGATNVGTAGQIFTGYDVGVTLNRPAFTAGGVQIQSETAGTLGAISLTVDGRTTLNIGAGFSDGLIQGPTLNSLALGFPTEFVDDFSGLVLDPHWPDFGAGYVCTDGTTTSCDPNVSAENVAALCQADPDEIAFRTNGSTGPVSVLCGTVTVNINVNAPFESEGACISTLKQQRCSGLTGNAKATCNHAQIGVCQASFNVHSAHN